ncbi:hypothetical protein [Clavibacter sp.]|uniref:hypothetical protein n=1 Tax=Clavibacter sp. TaxID=1871044 RepID=UPI0019C84D6D|nr:hypothetical protein [Clavibacter sp.]MBD5381903.1 hypothetical protein [Clavibacter sp.]
MKKYIVRIHTEEMKGRVDEVSTIDCTDHDNAEYVVDEYLSMLFKQEDVTDYHDTYDDKWIVEYFPKMRETITIEEA